VEAAIARLESLFFSPNPRRAGLARGSLFLAGAAAAALLVAVAGPIYALALALIILAALLILRDMRWGFTALLAVVALLPFGALPFKLGFTPTFLDVALLALFFVWIMRIATRRQPGLVGTWLGGAVLLFLALLALAFANGLRFGFPTVTTVRNVAELGLAVLLFFLVVNTLREEADLYFVAKVIMIGGAAAAAIAVGLYVIPQAWTVRILDALGRFNYPGGYGALRFIEDSTDNPMRAIGTMVDPNVLGGFMILVAALTAPQLVSRQPLFRRAWIALFLALEALALYLTYSRGSLVGLGVALLVIGLLRYRRLLFVALFAAALLLLLPPAQAYVAHFIEGVQLQDRATLMRLGEYRDAIGLIGRYPWLGVGFSGSPDADLYVGVSNLYLLIAEEMGVIGLAGFLLVVVVFLGSLWWAWRTLLGPGGGPTGAPIYSVLSCSNARLEALLLGLGAAVTGVMVGGLLDHYLFNLVYPHMSVLFWLLLGLGMCAVILVRERAHPCPGVS
jgi:polysaccharide biosynthesis protein PslJ